MFPRKFAFVDRALRAEQKLQHASVLGTVHRVLYLATRATEDYDYAGNTYLSRGYWHLKRKLGKKNAGFHLLR